MKMDEKSGRGTTPPPPGVLVPVNGVDLHLNCSGRGSPVIVLEAGLGDSSLVWAEVQSRLSASHRVCSYDRAGIGWSGAVSTWSARAGVAQLHALLHAAGEQPPYVLVGHSAGANYVLLFAHQYPEEAKAVVLIEPPILEHFSPAFVAVLKMIRGGIGVLSRLGAIRLLARAGYMKILFGGSVPPAQLSEAAGFLYRPESIRGSMLEVDALPDTIREVNRLSSAGALGDLPLTIITAHAAPRGSDPLMAALTGLARLSTKGHVVSVPSSHFVHFDEPQAIARLIEQTMENAK